jgi:hypothetical protein
MAEAEEETRRRNVRGAPDPIHPDVRILMAAVKVMNRSPGGGTFIIPLPCGHVAMRPLDLRPMQKILLGCPCSADPKWEAWLQPGEGIMLRRKENGG